MYEMVHPNSLLSSLPLGATAISYLALLHFISIQYVISYIAIETALFCFFSLPPSTNTAVLPGS
jgi:hypothetical protein